MLYSRKVQNSARVNLQMLLLDVPYLTLLMQRLGQQTTKLLIATVPPLFYLTLKTYLQIRLSRSTWLPTNNTLYGLG